MTTCRECRFLGMFERQTGSYKGEPIITVDSECCVDPVPVPRRRTAPICERFVDRPGRFERLDDGGDEAKGAA